MNLPALDFDFLRAQTLGVDAPLHTPFGERLLVYADFTASGRCLRFVELVVEPVLSHLKRHGAGQNLLAILTGNHPAHGKSTTVPDPLNFVIDWQLMIARSQEVGVHGVGQTVLDGPAGRHQRLAQHPAAKHIGKTQVFAFPLKMIVSDGGKDPAVPPVYGLPRACLLLCYPAA